MAEKKSWRDYSEKYSTKTSDDTEESKKAGSWRDYSQKYSSSNGGSTASGKSSNTKASWRDYSTTNPSNIAGGNITKRVNSWLSSYNSFISDYQKRYEGRKFNYEDAYMGDSADWLDQATQRKTKAYEEADDIISYIDQHKDYLDDKWVREIRRVIDNAKYTQTKVIDAATRDNEYWSKFTPNEEQTAAGYTADKLYNEWQTGQKQYADDMAFDIEAGELELEELKSTNPHDKQISELEDRIKRAKYVQGYEGYMANMNAADYGTNSQYVSTRTDVAMEDALWGYHPQYDTGKLFGDFMYDYINGNQDALDAAMVNDTSTNAYFFGFDQGFLKTMKDEEIGVYNYLYKTQGQDSANAYLSFLQDDLEGRRRIEEQKKWAKYAQEDPVGSSVFSVLISPLKGISYLGQAADMLDDGKLDQNAGYNRFSHIPASIRSQVSQTIEKSGKWGKVGSFAYNTGMSMGDFLFTTAVSGGNQTLSLAIMGSGAAADATIAAKDRGLEDGQAFALGTIAGIAEVAMEKISLGAWLEGDMSEGALKYLLKNALSEAGEEAGTSTINLLADVMIAGDKSEWKVAMQKYMDEGKSEAEAFGLVAAEQAAQIGLDALGGFFSGAAIGGGTYVGRSVAAGIKYGDTAKDKVASQQLVTEGLELNPDNQYIQKMQSKLDKGKNLSGMQVRNILAANQEQITSNDMKKIQLAAEKRLVNLGQTENVSEVAEIATKWATGQEITRAEKSLLANSQYGSRVANELLPDNILSGDYTSEWAEEIGTKQVNATAYNKKAIRDLIDAIANAEDTIAYKSLESRVEGETPAKVSDTGKAVIRATNEEVDLSSPKIKSITEESVVLDVNGKDVNIEEIDFATDDQYNAFNAIKNVEHITPGAANAMIAKVDFTKPVWNQLNGMDEAFTYGYYNYSKADLNAGLFTGNLTKEQLNDSYRLGQIAAENNQADKANAYKAMRTAAQAEAEKAVEEGKQAPKEKNLTISYNEGGGKVVSIDKAGIKDAKRSGAVEVAKILHKLGLGTRVEFFSSYLSKTLTDKDGNAARVFLDDNGVEQVAYAGVYRKGDGTIRVDLNAYNGKGLTLNALSHELTHFIQQWSDEKYKVLADFLIKSYEKTDMTMHDRVLREQKRLENIRGEEVSYDEAFDEVVANAMSKMFDDGKLVEKLTELKAQDEKLARKLWEGFKKILAKFLGIYENAGPLFRDTADIMAMKETFEQLQNMFAEALVEASDNYQASLTVAESQTLTEAGIGFDESTKSVYSLHFSTAYRDEIQVGKKTFDAEAVAQLVSKATNRSIEDARKWVKSELTVANIVMQNPEFLDFEADNRYDAIKKNSKYPQGTVDLSNLCPKREEFTTMFDMLQKKYPNKLFTAQDVAEMRKILAQNDITVACGACFVEDRRQLLGEIADTYINMWKEAVESGKPLQKTNAAGVKSDLLVTKALAKQYGLTPGTKIMATDTYIPTQYDLTTYEGFKLLEKNHPTIAMGFNRYNNSRGQQSARLIEGRAEYNRQILGWSDAKVRSVNNNGGLRIFSFSDFEVIHLLDLVQVIIDCAAKGVKIQGYTKIPAFAKLVRGTGIKLNRSLIPKGDYGYHMENGKVVLDYDTTEGIDINDDNFIDESDNPDVGNIVIGINPTQIGAAMLDSFIDYIIPFHSNKVKEILKKLGTGEWVNYKVSQHEKDISTGTSSKHNVNIYTEVLNKYHPTNKVEFVNAFLKECKRQGKIPRYAEFLNVDENGDYAYREGYHKLLVDFKMFDAEGNILPQGNITPSLDDGFMTDLLNAEIDKKQNYEFPQKVYDAIDKKFGEQYSSQETDSDGFKDYDVMSAVYTIRNEKAKRGQDLVKIGNMPTLYRELFGLSGDVYVSNEHLYKNMVSKATAEAEGRYKLDDSANYHELGEEKVINAIEQFQDPLVIMESLKDYAEPRLVAVLDEKGNDGQNLMAVMELYAPAAYPGKGQRRNHLLITIYEKNSLPDYIEKTVDKGRIMHIKEGSQLTRQAGLQLAGAVSTETLKKNVAQFNKKVNAFKEKNNIQYSSQETDLDSDGKKLTKEQVEFFKDSKVRDENGKLLVMYHGSQSLGFTVFDPNASDDNRSFFFSDSPKVAASYSNSEDEINPYTGTNKASGLYKTYLNFTNPYVVDARGSKWNNIVEFAEGDEFLGDIGSYLGIIRGMDSTIGVEDFLDSLRGDLYGATEYAINELHIDEDTEESLFTEQEQKDLLELAERIDKAYSEWDESKHLDEDGESTDFEAYVRQNYTAKNTRKIASEAYKNGYDGVIFKNLVDVGKFGNIAQQNYERSTVAVAFKSEQIKSVENKKPTADKDMRYSEHDTDYSNRSLLANAFEGITKSSVEYEMIQEYKNRIKLLNEQEEKLDKLNAEIRKIRFTPGEYDAQKLRELEAKAKETAKLINKHDRKLLSLEASEPLRKVIEQERKKEAQKTRERVKEIQQNKKLRAEQTELRHKIRKAVRDLDKLLNRGNKKQNVKEDMKGFVSKALELADYLFTDHISNDELIRKGITVRMTPKEAALVKETEDILSKLYDNADSLTDEEFTRLDAKRKANEDKLRDLLTAQRNERLNTPVYNLFNDLVTEYANLKNSNQEAVKASYDPNVDRFLRSYIGESDGETDSDRKTLLQNMRVADMTTDELWKLHNAYKMVLHSVRNANALWVKGKTETIEQMAGRIMGDFSKRKIPEGKVATVIRNLSNKIGWDYEKLYYALDRIGSEAFTELVMNIANSENIVMQDVMEAAAFRDEMVTKYGFNNWDVNKEIDREFLDNTGKKFKLTLGQLMALHAYSRREGAWDHIEYGGFVFGEVALTNPKPADSYKLSKAQCEAITNLLTKEQKGYAEDMQKFLSETMGAKGNEVSMLLYGINMFGEKNYFPIHIAGQFKAQAQESQAKAVAGFSSMSNAGFTHAQNPNAKAPFVLEGFNEIWTDHVNEMSRYHGTVPALEDMRRVMNRSSYSESGMDSMAIKQLMENSYGKEAVEYFDNLYREANSGAITDKLQKKSHKLLSLFRKNSVAYSLSVLVQQPASIVRAYNLVDRKYFGIKGFGTITSGIAKAASDKWTKAHTNAYNEMLKYAPGVTMAKEIGGFDTHTGGSIRSYLLDTNKSLAQKWKTGTAVEKGKAALDIVDDNPLANLPNLADKIAWIEIWNACKRETVATHKDLTPNSEEFMQTVGDRFTEVIRATQVYDSLFAKSPMLKSKNLAVQYLVSFMNEPNTVANMAEKAVRDVKKGNWKEGAKTATVVIHSIIFTNLLKSIVYAMRDDDEDETYIEKYIEAVAGNMMSDFSPFNYIPLARDAWSIAQGYDVERADMAIVSDVIGALNNAVKNATTDTEGMTEEQLIEFDKKVTETTWQLVGSLASVLGIPVKNIRREIKGVLDHAKIASANAGNTTAHSAWDKVCDAVIDSIPFMTAPSKQDKLYDAIISGDKAYVDRLKSAYKDDSAYQSAVRKALRVNDPRIHEAAQARYEGNTEDYKRIFREIQKEGNFSFDDIMSAINSEESAIKGKLEPKKATSSYSASDFVESIVLGDTKSAQAIKEDIISTKVANGKTQKEAEKEFASNVTTGIREAYTSGLLDEAGAEKMLMEYADKDEAETASKIRYWTFCEEYPEYDLTESNVNDYLDFAEPAEIPLDVFVQYINGTKGLAEKKDEWGDVEVTKREQVLEVIDSLPLTWEQKDALYLAAGYSESRIWDVPW